MSYQVTSYKGVLVVKQDKLEEPKRQRDTVSTRGKVRGFSRKSRKNLLRLINKLEPSENYYFVTLTYQHWEDDNAKLWAKQLDSLFKRLRYHYPASGGVWRLEFQKRKAPHFHVLLHIPTAPCAAKLKRQIKQFWSAILGQNTRWFLRYSVKVQHVGSDYKNCGLYSALYASKKDGEDRTDIKTGRSWGIFNKAHLPKSCFGSVTLSPQRQTILRRICRKWLQAHQKRHGYARYLSARHGSFDVFMPLHEQQRLLAFVKDFGVTSLSKRLLQSPFGLAA